MDDLISRKAAIEAVRKLVINGYGTDYGVIDSDIIYEALEDLTSEQPHTCGDCIHWRKYISVGRMCDIHDWVSKETDYCSLWEDKK